MKKFKKKDYLILEWDSGSASELLFDATSVTLLDNMKKVGKITKEKESGNKNKSLNLLKTNLIGFGILVEILKTHFSNQFFVNSHYTSANFRSDGANFLYDHKQMKVISPEDNDVKKIGHLIINRVEKAK